MTKEETQTHIESLFSDKEIFEEYVLNVNNDNDRKEIIEILVDILIGGKLRSELNFLYMKDLKSFHFSLIVNLLFRELADEWISYAHEQLMLTNKEAIEVLQEKQKALFIATLVKSYFKKYRIYFFEKIADSFIELVENMPTPLQSSILIDEVITGDFVKSKNVSVVYNYSHLWRHIKSAQGLKKKSITRYQIKSAEAQEKSDIHEIQKLHLKMEQEIKKPLAYFDEAVLRLRKSMVAHMMHMEF